MLYSPLTNICILFGMAGVVQGLIGRRQNPAAIRLIHAFKLVREFPPGPILENYFKYWKKISDEIFKSKNFTGEQVHSLVTIFC